MDTRGVIRFVILVVVLGFATLIFKYALPLFGFPPNVEMIIWLLWLLFMLIVILDWLGYGPGITGGRRG